ncbi:MAG: Hsp33 family molecular chaperone HslO [Clostridia bacterium]|nr:Hsp33 family molecular chaperone HslO [Clostridia bacterium]
MSEEYTSLNKTEDYIIAATAAGGTVRAFAATTTNMVREAKATHDLSMVSSAALGRTITAAAIMSKMLKGEKDTVTIQIKGNGPIGGLVVVSDSAANVRGYVYNPQVELPLNEAGKLDVGGAIGKEGYMNVIKDLGLKEPYIGYVDLVTGEIGDDIAYYFALSEQVPSVVALGVLVDTDGGIINAGGYIIQLMPGAEDSLINYIENTINAIPTVSQLLAYGESPESILEIIFGEKDLRINSKSPCRYLCNCSRDRMERNLISVGKDEIRSIIEEQHGAELHCHFCNKKYQFTEQELKGLIGE